MDETPGQDERKDRCRRIQYRCKARIQRLLGPCNQSKRNHAVEAGLKQEAAPDCGVGRHHHSAPTHDAYQHRCGDRGARRDERHRRDGLDANFDKRIRRTPEGGEQHQQCEFSEVADRA